MAWVTIFTFSKVKSSHKIPRQPDVPKAMWAMTPPREENKTAFILLGYYRAG